MGAKLSKAWEELVSWPIKARSIVLRSITPITGVLFALWCIAPISSVASELPGLERGYRSLQEDWNQIQDLLDSRAFSDSLGRLMSFKTKADRAGVGNMERHARALLARVGEMDGDIARQYGPRLIDAAESLAPRLAATRAERIRLALRFGIWDWRQLPIDLMDTVRWSWDRIGDRLSMMAYISGVLTFGTALSFAVALLVLLVRVSPVFYHVLTHFPGFALPFSGFALMCLGVACLLFLNGFGVVGSAFLVVAPCCLVSQPALRRLVYVMAMLSLALPFFASRIWDHVVFEESPLISALRCQEGLCWSELPEISKKEIGDMPFKGVAAYARGVTHTRKGEIRRAEAALQLAEEKGLSDPALDIARGNVLMLSLGESCPSVPSGKPLEGVVANALAYYRAALKQNEENLAARYNLAIALKLSGKQALARQAFARFTATGDGVVPPTGRRVTELVPYMPCRPGLGLAGSLAWGTLAPDTIMGVLGQLRKEKRSRDWVPFHELFLGPNDTSYLMILALSLALIVFAISLWRGGSRFSRICVLCQQSFCKMCGETGTATDHCPDCLMEQLKISPHDPKVLWLREIKRREDAQKKQRWVYLLAVLIPGMGHLCTEEPVRGFLMLWLWCLVLGLFLGPLGFLYGWPARFGSVELTTFIFPSLCLLMIYVFGVMDSLDFRRERG